MDNCVQYDDFKQRIKRLEDETQAALQQFKTEE